MLLADGVGMDAVVASARGKAAGDVGEHHAGGRRVLRGDHARDGVVRVVERGREGRDHHEVRDHHGHVRVARAQLGDDAV